MSQELALQGYILKTQDLGEVDLLLTFFTDQQGKVRFVVKSAKKLTSRLQGRLQPTALVEVNLVGKGGLAKLIGAQIIHNNSKIIDSQVKTAALQVMQEFTNRSLPDGEPNPELYQAYTSALIELDENSSAQVLESLNKFLVLGLSATGLAPGLLESSVSGGQVYFSAKEGKFSEVSVGVDSMKISKEVYQLYQALLHNQQIRHSEQANSILLKLLNDFASYQLERPLLAVQNFFTLSS